MSLFRNRLSKQVVQGIRYVTHHLALKWRLMLMLTLLMITTLSALGLISFRIYSDNIIGKTITRKHEMGSSMLEAIGIIRGRDDYGANQIMRNDEIMEALSYSGPQTEFLRYLEIRNCTKALMDLVDKSNIVGLAVLGKNGKSFYSKSESERTNDEVLQRLTNTREIADGKGESIWIPSKVNVFGVTDDAPANLYVVKRLYSIRNANDQDVGLSITQVQYSRLYEILKRTTGGDDAYALLADANGVILCSTLDQESVTKSLPDGIAGMIGKDGQGSFTLNIGTKPILYLYNRDAQSGWLLVQAIPYSVIRNASSEVRQWTVIVTAFFLIVALSLAWLFARSFVEPVVNLEKIMKQFGGGDLTARSVTARSDELGNLQQGFNSMAGQIGSLLESMKEEHRQKRSMEFRILEYQINPHFLYNSLDTINWMALSSGNKEIAEMATSLAKFFRLGLNKGKEILSIGEEAEHAHSYLIISRIRYHDGFSFDISVDPEVRDFKTIKLIIQPLVENVLVHAIRKTGTGGHVEIRAFQRMDKVIIEVEDNGRGMSPEKLAEIRAMLARKPQEDEYGGGIGLMNVQQRIHLNYGMDYGLEIESQEKHGTLARMVLPIIH
jgi:two-component system, sensor histidine kinase YesM